MTTITKKGGVSITTDKTVVPGQSYTPIFTDDGERIPFVLGRNLTSGGVSIFENGATFSNGTATYTVNGVDYVVNTLIIT